MASGKEGGGRRKRGRTPDEPRKGKDKAGASPDADLCPICWEKPAGFVGIPECVSVQGYGRGVQWSLSIVLLE